MTEIILLVLLALAIRYWWFWTPGDTSRFYPSNHPLFIAHRGLPGLNPENTLMACQAAVTAGFRAVEIDVVHSRDGTIYCSHNFDLERETDGLGWIDDSSNADIAELKTGIYSHPDRPVPLDTLEDVLDRMPDDIIMNIEIKFHGVIHLRHAVTVARQIKARRRSRTVIISSFNPFVLWVIKAVDSSLATALILESTQFYWTINLVHPDLVHPEAELVTPDLVRRLTEKKLRINVWTVNNIPAVRWLLDRGVSGIITDNPRVLEAWNET
ncbi:MAG: glycerophosphodiester phosphodiesterase [Fidelibacterota bacterium]